MKGNWASSFFENFDVDEAQLHRLPNIDDYDKFVQLANKYRNIFRDNFSYSEPLSYQESYSFLNNLGEDNSRVWYGVSFKKEWIGQFGVRNLGDNNLCLDNALRFSAKGGKDLFKAINRVLINHIRQYLPDYNILIIVKKSNKLALKLHSGFGFKDCSERFCKRLAMDPLLFSVMILDEKKVNINDENHYL